MARTTDEIEAYNERIKQVVCNEALREIESITNDRGQILHIRLRAVFKQMKVDEFKKLTDEIIADLDRFHDSILQKPEFRLDEVETKLDGN